MGRKQIRLCAQFYVYTYVYAHTQKGSREIYEIYKCVHILVYKDTYVRSILAMGAEFACTHTHKHTHTHTYTYMHTHTHTHIRKKANASYLQSARRVWIHNIYTHTHTHADTHTHIHTLSYTKTTTQPQTQTQTQTQA